MDLYLIQDPKTPLPRDPDPEVDDPSGYNEHLLRYYRNSVPIRNIQDLLDRIRYEVTTRKRLIKRLIIGSHGAYVYPYPGARSGTGYFYIGKTYISESSDDEMMLLSGVARFFVRNADVYIVACKTGNDTAVLKKLSKALGGVRVHGYTDYITTTNYGLFVTLDDGTEDGGQHIVCLPGDCSEVR
jgi:hypothetical protein